MFILNCKIKKPEPVKPMRPGVAFDTAVATAFVAALVFAVAVGEHQQRQQNDDDEQQNNPKEIDPISN